MTNATTNNITGYNKQLEQDCSLKFSGEVEENVDHVFTLNIITLSNRFSKTNQQTVNHSQNLHINDPN